MSLAALHFLGRRQKVSRHRLWLGAQDSLQFTGFSVSRYY
jgi:hypothetical protein